MYLENLFIVNFRNYNKQKFKFTKGINLIVGKNGIGKTNILESIYLMSTTMSHRTYRMSEMVKEQANSFKISGKLISDDSYIDIELKYQKNTGLKTFVNNTKSRRSELLQLFPAVLFSPEDVQILKGPPKDLRRLMNVFISQLNPKYISNLIDYKKILKERNTLIKKAKTNDKQFEIWTKALLKYGNKISEERIKFIEIFNRIINKEILEMALDRNLNLKYNISKYEGDKSIRSDSFAGHTTWGPHRDSYTVLIDDMDIRKYGSRGETRLAGFILRIAAWSLLKDSRGYEPVALLDDIFSELDSDKKDIVSRRLKNVQSIMTATEIPENFERADNIIYL